MPLQLKSEPIFCGFDNNVAMISFENAMATVIEDSSVAATVKMMLEFMWKFLPQLSADLR